MKKSVLTIVLMIGILTSLCGFPSYSAEYDDDNSHRYEIIDKSLTWEEAESECRNKGGHLATITSYQEQLYIQSVILPQGEKNCYWLGAEKSDNQSTFKLFKATAAINPTTSDGWRWITGEVWGNYLNWAYGEPNNKKGEYSEDKLMIYNGTNPKTNNGSGLGFWNDISPTGEVEGQDFYGIENFGYICEWGNEKTYSGFSANKDGWPLVNTAATFGYEEDYRIPVERYHQVFGFNIVKQFFKILPKLSKWNGSCYGLCSSALEAYYGISNPAEPISHYNQYEGLFQTGYDHISQDSSMDSYYSLEGNAEAISKIERAQLHQLAKEYKNTEVLKNDSNYSDLLSYLNGNNSQPLLVTLATGSSGHAVIIPNDCKPIPISNTSEYIIPLYDSNAPSNSNRLPNAIRKYHRGPSYLIINTKTTQWSYVLDGKLTLTNRYKSNYFKDGRFCSSIRYYDFSKLDVFSVSEPLNLFVKKSEIFFNSSNIEINDEEGEPVLIIEEGEIELLAEGSEIDIIVSDYDGVAEPKYLLSTDETQLSVCSNGETELLGLSKEYAIASSASSDVNVEINFDKGRARIETEIGNCNIGMQSLNSDVVILASEDVNEPSYIAIDLHETEVSYKGNNIDIYSDGFDKNDLNLIEVTESINENSTPQTPSESSSGIDNHSAPNNTSTDPVNETQANQSDTTPQQQGHRDNTSAQGDVQPGKMDSKLNGIVKGSDGKWAMYKDGKVDTSYNGIAKNQYGWWKVTNGYVTFKENGIFKNEYGWWRVEDSRVNFRANGIYKNQYGWWKTTDGKVTFKETGIFKNEYGWWRVEDSKVNFKADGIYKNAYGWWKTTNGKVTFKENGVFKNEYGWWKVKDSKVDFSFTGIASNKYGKWYIKDGKVDFSKNGKVKYNGATYSIKNGKVQ